MRCGKKLCILARRHSLLGADFYLFVLGFFEMGCQCFHWILRNKTIEFELGDSSRPLFQKNQCNFKDWRPENISDQNKGRKVEVNDSLSYVLVLKGLRDTVCQCSLYDRPKALALCEAVTMLSQLLKMSNNSLIIHFWIIGYFWLIPYSDFILKHSCLL